MTEIRWKENERFQRWSEKVVFCGGIIVIISPRLCFLKCLAKNLPDGQCCCENDGKEKREGYVGGTYGTIIRFLPLCFLNSRFIRPNK